MIKKYCDSCGCEITKSALHRRKDKTVWSGGSAVILNSGSGISVRVDVNATCTDGSVTLYDVCDGCISEAIACALTGKEKFRRLASDKPEKK